MKLTIYLVVGHVEFTRIEPEQALQVVEAFKSGEPFITLMLDDDGITHIQSSHIVRMDLDQPEEAA